jgi:hypothetical protein
MISEQWIKTLATAEFDQGSWRTKNPKEIQKQLEQKVMETVQVLFNEVKDSCEIFNQYSVKATTLRLLPISSHHEDFMEGFVLLYGNVQLKVLYDQNQLVARFIAVDGFSSEAKICVIFRPCFDALGSLYWKTENGVLMNYELMVKTLFETIVREAALRQ